LSGRLLLLARLDRAAAGEPFATSKVDLAELTQDVVDGLNDAAVSRDVHVHLRSLGQVTVEAHEEWMLRALHNVINNAIKYTEPATNVVIDIEPTADASAVMVSVSDAGPGIAPNERRHVLQRFYRGVRTHATEGTGLGLAIVHDVMRALGGDVMIAEGPGGKGARITLVVPVTPRPGGRRH
jgi:two-component system sensor histidine kinase TctE